MKTSLLISALVFSSSLAWSQDKTAEAQKQSGDTSAEKTKKILPTIDMTPSQYEGKRVVYGGLLVHLARTDRPVRSLNPLGPAPAGSVTENLSADPRTGKPDGVRFFTISFKKW